MGEVLVNEGEKPGLDVEVAQIEEEEKIGADSGPEPVVGQALEFVKELSRHIDQDHPLLAFHFLIWEQDPLPTCATERTTLKSTSFATLS